MERKSQTLIYTKESAMNEVSARRTIAVLAISTAVLLTGTIYGYAAVKAEAVKTSVVSTATLNVYGTSSFMGPLTSATVNTTAETAISSVYGPSHLTGPLK